MQGVYVGSASPLIADIKTEPYSVITYSEGGTLMGTYDNAHDIPIYVDQTYYYSMQYFFLRPLPTAFKNASNEVYCFYVKVQLLTFSPD